MAARTTLIVALLAGLSAAAVQASAVDGMWGTPLPAGAEPALRFLPDDPIQVDDDRLDIPEPADWGVSEYYDFARNTLKGPRTPKAPERAANVNTIGEVPDSSWFTNRHGRRPMAREELVRGPDTSGGPAPGTWTVVGRPSAGVQPKFTVEDERGRRFLVKFDPPSNHEMASAAEVICTKFFHALGYNVAETYIAHFDRDQLEIDPEATFRSPTGERRPVTEEDLAHWLHPVEPGPDGRYRVLASRWLPGTPVGEFRYYGTRPDDPNDLFAHEDRRELRGLRLFSAWLNHDDSRAENTFDAWVEEDGRSFIRHYLLDFGSCLGSGTYLPNDPRATHEYLLELAPVMKSLGTLGIWRRPWVGTLRFPEELPGVGNIEAEFFDPPRWRGEYPNPAFLRMDMADAFWAARVVSRFSDEDIGAIVTTGELSDPAAEAELAEIIRRRRDKVVAYWLTGTNPVDEVSVGTDGTLVFVNAAEKAGVASAGSRYRVRWHRFDNATGATDPVGDEITTDRPSVEVPGDAWGPQDPHGYRYALATVVTEHPDHPSWAEPAVVVVRRGEGPADVVGLRRPLVRREFPYMGGY